MRKQLFALAVAWALAFGATATGEPLTIDLWPGAPPGPVRELPSEGDTTTPSDPLVAGRPVIRLGNVSTPQIVVYRPPPEIDTGTAVIICPGGGYYILAYDLEGTEIAAWLNTLGITGIVLKYRVPIREFPLPAGLPAVQDVQRALAVVRHHAADWNLAPQRIGVCGFSAGGHAAAWATLTEERSYEPADEMDTTAADPRPNFAILVYAGGWIDDTTDTLKEGFTISASTPPIFLTAAFNDPLSPIVDSLELTSLLHSAGGSSELHLFAKGGHGFGLRPTDEPVTAWPELASSWMARMGFLKKGEM
jgi:acetyl esterase/lipase